MSRTGEILEGRPEESLEERPEGRPEENLKGRPKGRPEGNEEE